MYIDTNACPSPSFGPSSLESIEHWLDHVEFPFNHRGPYSCASPTGSVSLTSLTDGDVDGANVQAHDSVQETSINELGDAQPRAEVFDVPSDVEVQQALDRSYIGTLGKASHPIPLSSNQSLGVDLSLSFPFNLAGHDCSSAIPCASAAAGPSDSGPHSVPLPPNLTNAGNMDSLPFNPSTPSYLPPPSRAGSGQLPLTLMEMCLYGSSSPARWSTVGSLVQSLTSKPAIRGVVTVTHRLHSRYYHVESDWGSRSVAVHDYTTRAPGPVNYRARPECPSLAIIFLPLPGHVSVPDHSCYLPIITQDLGAARQLLQEQWELLGLPALLSKDGRIITDNELAHLDAAVVAAAMPVVDKSFSTRLVSEEHMTKVPRTPWVMLVIVCMFSTFLGSQLGSVTTASSQVRTWGAETALLASSLKDCAATIFYSGSCPQWGQTSSVSPNHTRGTSSEAWAEVSLPPVDSAGPTSHPDLPPADKTSDVSSTEESASDLPVETQVLSFRLITDTLSGLFSFRGLEDVTETLEGKSNERSGTIRPDSFMEQTHKRKFTATNQAQAIQEYGWMKYRRARKNARAIKSRALAARVQDEGDTGGYVI